MRLDFFDFLSRLPEEEIRADRGAQHADDKREVNRRELRLRYERRHEQCLPIGLHDDTGEHVRHQENGQELEDAHVAPIGNENLEQHDADGKGDDQQPKWRIWGEQTRASGHRAEIRADIDGVGDEQQQHRAKQDASAVVLPHDARDALVGHQPDAPAHLLDRDHEREHVEREPEQTRTEGRAGLRIGSDARGIVVGGASDKTWAKHTEEATGPAQRMGHSALWQVVMAA